MRYFLKCSVSGKCEKRVYTGGGKAAIQHVAELAGLDGGALDSLVQRGKDGDDPAFFLASTVAGVDVQDVHVQTEVVVFHFEM